jgi:hypothetical protein
MMWAGQAARMGEDRKVYKVLVGKPKGKRRLGRPRRRWEDGIRMDLKEIGVEGVDWIRLSQDRDRWRAVVSAVMNLRVLAPRSLFKLSVLFLHQFVMEVDDPTQHFCVHLLYNQISRHRPLRFCSEFERRSLVMIEKIY